MFFPPIPTCVTAPHPPALSSPVPCTFPLPLPLPWAPVLNVLHVLHGGHTHVPVLLLRLRELLHELPHSCCCIGVWTAWLSSLHSKARFISFFMAAATRMWRAGWFLLALCTSCAQRTRFPDDDRVLFLSAAWRGGRAQTRESAVPCDHAIKYLVFKIVNNLGHVHCPAPVCAYARHACTIRVGRRC